MRIRAGPSLPALSIAGRPPPYARGQIIVLERFRGLIAVTMILGGVLLVLVLNLNLKGPNPPAPAGPTPAPVRPGSARRPADFREYPVGEEVERNQMRIAAVWLPPIQMDGFPAPSEGPSSIIHLEADIKGAEGNRNGCAKDEFVPYLTVHYTIAPSGAKAQAKPREPVSGEMMPMVARDGWHYGATIEMPSAGHYTLTYKIEPPSALSLPGGCRAGRHSDAATGVDPWWQPFEVSFDWDYPGPPGR
jgi:uncharacterized protein involved in high-affinity Fe2+ transport